MWFLGVCIVLFIVLFIQVQKQDSKQSDNSSSTEIPKIPPEKSISNRFSQPESMRSKERTLVEEKFFVTGVSYYLGNIGKLACQNPDWKKLPHSLSPPGWLTERSFGIIT